MRRHSSDTARRAGLLAVAGVLAAALAAVGARLGGRASGGTLTAPARRRARGRFQRSAAQTYTCECGAEYRVSGAGRHRVYWPAAAPEEAPVLGDRCAECDAPLPRGRAARPA